MYCSIKGRWCPQNFAGVTENAGPNIDPGPLFTNKTPSYCTVGLPIINLRQSIVHSPQSLGVRSHTAVRSSGCYQHLSMLRKSRWKFHCSKAHAGISTCFFRRFSVGSSITDLRQLSGDRHSCGSHICMYVYILCLWCAFYIEEVWMAIYIYIWS